MKSPCEQLWGESSVSVRPPPDGAVCRWESSDQVRAMSWTHHVRDEGQVWEQAAVMMVFGELDTCCGNWLWKSRMSLNLCVRRKGPEDIVVFCYLNSWSGWFLSCSEFTQKIVFMTRPRMRSSLLEIFPSGWGLLTEMKENFDCRLRENLRVEPMLLWIKRNQFIRFRTFTDTPWSSSDKAVKPRSRLYLSVSMEMSEDSSGGAGGMRRLVLSAQTCHCNTQHYNWQEHELMNERMNKWMKEWISSMILGCGVYVFISFSSSRLCRMTIQSAISREIFTPLHEKLLTVIEVKKRRRRRLTFIPAGRKGEYITFLCLSGILFSITLIANG